MVKINRRNQHPLYAATNAIASVETPSASSQWHGIASIVRMFDGRVIESTDRPEVIVAQVERDDE